MTWIENLHQTLDRRATPEQVARIIRDSGIRWPAAVQVELHRVAAARPSWYVSSMSEDFERADDCAAQLAAVGRMFGVDVSDVRPDDLPGIRALITELGKRLGGWMPGHDWKADRLNKAGRRSSCTVVARGLASKRQYNRHVRVLRHLWDKAVRMGGMQRQRELVLTGRSGFASRITLDRFRADPAMACFVAYFTARKNVRRAFTLAGRENPVDQLAQGLLDAVLAGRGADWEMLAWVYPRPVVLARLTPRQLGVLLGDWHAVMAATAAELERAWPGDESVNRMTMIVRRGMDSSTWNTMAQAYNAARAAWLGCVAASGALALLEPACPGKVMRLMAADLAWWHQSSGGDVEPNTVAWARLPLPWQVLQGTRRCTAADVRAACAQGRRGPRGQRLDGPAAGRHPGASSRRPQDLVHGIAVADPAWAAVLRSGLARSAAEKIKAGYAADLAAGPGGASSRARGPGRGLYGPVPMSLAGPSRRPALRPEPGNWRDRADGKPGLDPGALPPGRTSALA